MPGSGAGSAQGGGGSAGATLNLWDQCGGKGGNCASYQCVDGLYPGSSCQRLHEFYSQCRPAGSSYGTCEQVRQLPLTAHCGLMRGGAAAPAWA